MWGAQSAVGGACTEDWLEGRVKKSAGAGHTVSILGGSVGAAPAQFPQVYLGWGREMVLATSSVV